MKNAIRFLGGMVAVLLGWWPLVVALVAPIFLGGMEFFIPVAATLFLIDLYRNSLRARGRLFPIPYYVGGPLMLAGSVLLATGTEAGALLLLIGLLVHGWGWFASEWALAASSKESPSEIRAQKEWLWGKGIGSALILLSLAGGLGAVLIVLPASAAPLWKGDSRTLERTVIAPSLDASMTAGKNLVYCGSFQLAWNALKEWGKGDIALEGNPTAVAGLNAGKFGRQELDPGCCLAMSGLGGDRIVDKVNEELKAKFGSSADPLSLSLRSDDILLYAYLSKDLKFEPEFESLEDGLSFQPAQGPARKIQAFGIRKFKSGNGRHRGLSGMVEAYGEGRMEDGFAVRIRPPSSADEIVFARIEPRETLQKTLEVAEGILKTGKPRELPEDVKLGMPKFNFDLTHVYRELQGRRILNKALAGHPIQQSVQRIRFRLDERGAQLRSSAFMVLAKCMPARLVFDRPFLLYLKEKKAERPYFVMWVDNPELMAPLPE